MSTRTEWGVRLGTGSVRPEPDEDAARREADSLRGLFHNDDVRVVSRVVSDWRDAEPAAR